MSSNINFGGNGQINLSDIKFIHKDTLYSQIKGDKLIADAIFKKYDTDNNNILSQNELSLMNADLEQIADSRGFLGLGKKNNMGKKEASDFYNKIGVNVKNKGNSEKREALYSLLKEAGLQSKDVKSCVVNDNGESIVSYKDTNDKKNIQEIFDNNTGVHKATKYTDNFGYKYTLEYGDDKKLVKIIKTIGDRTEVLDANGQLISEVLKKADGSVTETKYEYKDGVRNCVSTSKDANGNITNEFYNLGGKTGNIAYERDSKGRTIKTTLIAEDGTKSVQEFGYDDSLKTDDNPEGAFMKSGTETDINGTVAKYNWNNDNSSLELTYKTGLTAKETESKINNDGKQERTFTSTKADGTTGPTWKSIYAAEKVPGFDIPVSIELNGTVYLVQDGKVLINNETYSVDNYGGLVTYKKEKIDKSDNKIDINTKPQDKEIKPNENKATTTIPKYDNVDDYLKNDTQYQKYEDFLQKCDIEMEELEKKYDLSRKEKLVESVDDIRKHSSNLFEDKSFNIFNMPENDRERYNRLEMDYFYLKESLPKYKKVMSNWEDGHYCASFSRVAYTWTNIERITLKNGVHAYKSDQGVFYPHADGDIGLDTVPKDLIPD